MWYVKWCITAPILLPLAVLGCFVVILAAMAEICGDGIMTTMTAVSDWRDGTPREQMDYDSWGF